MFPFAPAALVVFIYSPIGGRLVAPGIDRLHGATTAIALYVRARGYCRGALVPTACPNHKRILGTCPRRHTRRSIR
ncbi:MAG: hypothetical protein JWQ50_310 [Caballeronia mineralivorans]|nr:hypothetical protein [Caballeronia mineralivorans]